jgi:CRP/FNR family cyclic AMP-dependent transcriptional regulator
MALSHLKKIALLRNLPEKQLRRIHAISRQEEFPAGSMIVKKSEAGEYMYLVVSGRIKIFCYSSARKRKTFAYLSSGDFFGEMAAIMGVGRTASAQTVEPTKLILIKNSEFKKLILSDNKLCYNLLRVMAERLRRANEEIESLLFRNILGRVSKTLNDLSKTCGKAQGDGVIFTQSYTHQELADLVGTTREPLSRALAMLRRADLVDSRRGRIFIRDPKKLEDMIRTSVETN